jgi:hypothetical protein
MRRKRENATDRMATKVSYLWDDTMNTVLSPNEFKA